MLLQKEKYIQIDLQIKQPEIKRYQKLVRICHLKPVKESKIKAEM